MRTQAKLCSGLGHVWRAMMWGSFALLLCLPALAMALRAKGVDWSRSDFIIMGALLAALGTGIEIAVRFLPSRRAQVIAAGLAVLVFLVAWVELAVGVFGTPFAGS